MKVVINNGKLFKIICIILVLLVCGIGIWVYYLNARGRHQSQVENQKKLQVATENKKESVIHMAAMGDMLAHDTIIQNAKNDAGYDFSKYFANIRSAYGESELIFCNQEGLSSGDKFGIAGYPSFNAPEQFSSGLQSGAGCNAINLANNHIGDRGIDAIYETLDVWSELKPALISGANKSVEDQKKVNVTTINDIRVSLVSFMDFSNNRSIPAYAVNSYHDELLVRELMAEARKNSDLVIVSMHWGIEDSNTVSADQEAVAKLMSSLGADIIIGTGPHVLQKMQTINRDDGGKTYVWYSLGNMLSSQLTVQERIGGIAMFDIAKKDSVISVSNLSFIPTYMHYEWTIAEEAAGDLLARKNTMIYLLKDAAVPLSKSLLNTTVEEQREYVEYTLGSEVTIK